MIICGACFCSGIVLEKKLGVEAGNLHVHSKFEYLCSDGYLQLGVLAGVHWRLALKDTGFLTSFV